MDQGNLLKINKKCHHCGILLLPEALGTDRVGIIEGRGGRIWCRKCSNFPRGNCNFCKDSVLEEKNCWELQSLLDRTAMRVDWGSENCPLCAVHDKVTRLEIIQFKKNSVTLGCYHCGTTQVRQWQPGKWPEKGTPPFPNN